MTPEELKRKEDKAFQELEKKYQKLRQAYNAKCRECDYLESQLEALQIPTYEFSN